MKKYLLTDIAAALLLLTTICVGGFTYMDSKTKEIEQALKEKPIEVVRKEMLARDDSGKNRTQGELTMFERSARDMNKFEVASKTTEIE